MDMNLATYGSDLIREIIPLYGVALVLFAVLALFKGAFGGRDEILTLRLSSRA